MYLIINADICDYQL